MLEDNQVYNFKNIFNNLKSTFIFSYNFRGNIFHQSPSFKFSLKTFKRHQRLTRTGSHVNEEEIVERNPRKVKEERRPIRARGFFFFLPPSNRELGGRRSYS